jgi:heptosyltransferase-1
MAAQAHDQRILIIKPSSLGDVVHALPTLAMLRSRFPSAHIAWLVKEQWSGLLERAEGLDKIWPIQPGLKGWLAIIPQLRAERFDIVVDLQGLLRSGVVGWLTGAARRIGFANAREGSVWLYSEKVPVALPDMHAVDRYLLVAARLGAPSAGQPSPAFRLRRLPEDHKAVADVLARHGLSEKTRWIAINPFARWPTKRWPLESFAGVADRIQQQGWGRIVLFGGGGDKPQAQAMMQRMHTAAVDVTGEMPIKLLPALLESAAVLLTNDSGPMHIAAAVGTPVVALFGPTNPARTGPYGSRHTILQHKIPCSPCYSRRCHNVSHLECLVNISEDTVLAAVRDSLRPIREYPRF